MTAAYDSELSASPALPVAMGEILAGKYRVERLVGMGGMAAVVAGTHIELDQPIAIKILLPEQGSTSDAVRRFLTEARAAAKLRGVHVARIYDVGTSKTASGTVVPFIVMELLEGSDLATVVSERGRITAVDAVEYVLQACDAVAEAHELGIIHRDIKPANLFLTQSRDGDPIVKLLDFGISTPTHGVRDGSNSGDLHMGSPNYMSPEQIRQEGHVDLRTDIWSLGIVLQELLTGEPAFGGTGLDVFVDILHNPPRSIEKLAPEVPLSLCEIVSKCLEKDPARRYQSVNELGRALCAFRGEEFTVRRAKAFVGTAVPVEPVPRRRRRSSVALAAAGAAAALALVLASTLLAIALQSTTRAAASPPQAPRDEVTNGPAVEDGTVVPEPNPDSITNPGSNRDANTGKTDSLAKSPASSTATPATRPARSSARPGTPAPKSNPPQGAIPRHRTEW